MSGFNISEAKKIIHSTNPIVIFDIGAHNFADSILLKQSFPNASVYAFEPDKNNLQNYSYYAQINEVNVIDMAVSDIVGETTFYNSETLNGSEWTCSGSIIKPITLNGTNEELAHRGLLYNMTGYIVKVTNLKNFCDTRNIAPDIIHMDAQGAETKIINGLGNYRPKIIFTETAEFDTYETGTNLKEFDLLMEKLNYKIFQRLEYDTFYVHNSF